MVKSDIMSPLPQLPHLFVFDVDGTLLSSRLAILPSTRESIGQLLGHGHRVALASARPPRSVAQLSGELLGEVVEMIALNGAVIGRGDDLYADYPLPGDAAAAALAHARSEGLKINVYSALEWFVEEEAPDIMAEARIVGFAPTRVPDLLDILKRPVHKLLCLGGQSQVSSFRDWVLESGFQLEATLSKATYCEVVRRGVSKAGAVETLAESLGFATERVVAFGDGENDLAMITAAGIGVAMGNAVPAVKQSAQLVTADNDSDGIAAALAGLGFVAS